MTTIAPSSDLRLAGAEGREPRQSLRFQTGDNRK
jgi:hypothetical protein